VRRTSQQTRHSQDAAETSDRKYRKGFATSITVPAYWTIHRIDAHQVAVLLTPRIGKNRLTTFSADDAVPSRRMGHIQRKTWMPADKTLDQALAELAAVIGRLENAVDMRIEHQRQNSEIEGEVRRVHEDRARLAQELDQSQFRANRLEEVNREVSRRLVTAMETIRAVLDR
jgi:hypothetical protein